MPKPRSIQLETTDVLRRKILAGEFRPGEFLSESRVASKLNCNMAPARAAIHRLQFEGLLEVKPQCGTMVRTLTSPEIDEILTVRALLESAVVERLAQFKRPSLLRLASSINFRMLRLARQRSHAARMEFVDLDLKFHCELASAAGFAETIAPFLASLRNRFRLVAEPRGDGCSRDTVREHTAILRALRAGDVQRAREALATHLAHARERWDSRIGIPLDATRHVN